jgi:hypothetical protein
MPDNNCCNNIRPPNHDATGRYSLLHEQIHHMVMLRSDEEIVRGDKSIPIEGLINHGGAQHLKCRDSLL